MHRDVLVYQGIFKTEILSAWVPVLTAYGIPISLLVLRLPKVEAICESQ